MNWKNTFVMLAVGLLIVGSAAVAMGGKDKVILVQGINTELPPLDPFFIPPVFANLYSLLLTMGYQRSDILIYSYKGGTAFPIDWLPNDYKCSDTGQAINASVGHLRKMIKDYNNANPGTRFYIVGHSLGGLIAFLTLDEVLNGNIPAGLIAKVITVDSPLEGPNSNIESVGALLTLLGVGPCHGELVTMDAPQELFARAHDGGVRALNTARATSALQQKGVVTATFGNIDDCVYNLSGDNQAGRQIIYDVPVPPFRVKLDHLGNFDAVVPYGLCGHASYLATITGARVIANEIPKTTRVNYFQQRNLKGLRMLLAGSPDSPARESFVSAAASTTILHQATFDSGVSCTNGGWTAVDLSGRGNFMAPVQGATVVQEDQCARDLSCMWAALSSTELYLCGGHPVQKVVPTGNAFGQYIANEIWSPLISIAGTSGSEVNLEFSVYRDLPLDRLVFYTWSVRDSDLYNFSEWKSRGFVYYGGQKDWFRHVEPIGDLLNLASSTHIQVALGVLDMCHAWCGVIGWGSCHSHAPLLDSVRIYRVERFGPQWSIRDIDQFQDNFANGAGKVRADMAGNILGPSTPLVLPGDSTVVEVADPVTATYSNPSGLATDPVAGGKAAYVYVAVWPTGQASKSGSALTQDGIRWPRVGSNNINGIVWDRIRLDQCTLYDEPVINTFCVDLNDNLFEPGDTVCFFYSAVNTNGITTYASGSDLSLQTDDPVEAATNASEFTCLPAGGWGHGGDILYVDGMDGRGAQRYWDTAFETMGLLDEVDRFDVRAASSAVSNRLSSRVQDVDVQLLQHYRKLLWDCGDLSVTLGDGSGMPERTNDYGLLAQFLDGLQATGGLYLCGDDVAQELSSSVSSFHSVWIPYSMSSPNGGSHADKGYGISPLVHTDPAGYFGGERFVAYGGCPLKNDFDVMTPVGTSVSEATYGAPNGGVWTPEPTNSAIISNVKSNSNAVNVGVILSGFSFIYIRDDENDGVLDRAKHLHDIVTWLGNTPPQPVGTGTVASNSLSQNYPNPFNPQTTIAFSVKARGPVSLKVYNVAGQLVRTLANEEFAVGPHKKVWDGRDDAGQAVASGVYFYKLVAKNFSQTKKMVMLK